MNSWQRSGRDRPAGEKLVPSCKERAYYNRIKKPGAFKMEDLRALARHYNFSDRELCLMCGVEYKGATTA